MRYPVLDVVEKFIHSKNVSTLKFLVEKEQKFRILRGLVTSMSISFRSLKVNKSHLSEQQLQIHTYPLLNVDDIVNMNLSSGSVV